MSDHLSDPPPYEPPPEEEGLYEWETEEEGAGPNILWGRVIAIVVGLVLVFFAGRLTAGGGGEVDDTQLDSLRQRNAELQDNVAQLEAELMLTRSLASMRLAQARRQRSVGQAQ